MQDRFKFRVWNKEQDRFHHSFSCDITASGTLVISQGIEGKKYIVDDDNYVVQQCTGLKDKNGKLIYEGDILKLAEFGKPVEVKHRALGFVLRREPSNTVGYDNDKYIPEDCEVIGNIYENPKLLEVEE